MNINEEKDSTIKPEGKSKMRQIVIESDGNVVHLIRAEVNGRIELIGILQRLLEYLNNQK